jgi:hypothetical protein
MDPSWISLKNTCSLLEKKLKEKYFANFSCSRGRWWLVLILHQLDLVESKQELWTNLSSGINFDSKIRPLVRQPHHWQFKHILLNKYTRHLFTRSVMWVRFLYASVALNLVFQLSWRFCEEHCTFFKKLFLATINLSLLN